MHDIFLKKALANARLGRGMCAPNPSVGAVAVRAGKVLAEGFHQGPGQPHAEQVVLSQLPPGLSDVILYVTLEPCNHWGRTPPCVEAIVAYGIQEVVYGYSDPNPIVQQNHTPQQLAARGVHVTRHALPEIDAFYESYQHWNRTRQPWVTVKYAQSLDGYIADAGGIPIQLSNAACHAFTHEQRAQSDGILTTATTVLRDEPELNARLPLGARSKNLVILDRALQVPLTARCIQAADQCWIFHASDAAASRHHPRVHEVSTPVHQGQLDLRFVMSFLGELGWHDVWVEAGGVLSAALHAAGLVNRTYVYVTPHLLGTNAVPAYVNKTIFQRQHSVSWRVLENNAVLVVDWRDPEVSNDH